MMITFSNHGRSCQRPLIRLPTTEMQCPTLGLRYAVVLALFGNVDICCQGESTTDHHCLASEEPERRESSWNRVNVAKAIEEWMKSMYPEWLVRYQNHPKELNLADIYRQIRNDSRSRVCNEDEQEMKVLVNEEGSSECRLLDVSSPTSTSWSNLENIDYVGNVDQETGRFQGNGLIRIKFKKGSAPFMLDAMANQFQETLEIRGYFRNGWLHGKAMIVSKDEQTILEASFVNGCLHGTLSLFAVEPSSKFPYLEMVGAFTHGTPVGPFWFFDNLGQMIRYYEATPGGEEKKVQRLEFGAFIYPDFETAIVGHFKRHVLMSGKESKVLGEKCHGSLKQLSFGMVDEATPTFRYDPPTHYRFGDDPTVQDPYERKNVQVRPSPSLHGEESLFALRPIPINTIVAFYSGLIVPCNLKLEPPLSFVDSSDDRIFVRSQYNMLIPDLEPEGLCLDIDIPDEFGRGPEASRLKSTIGHKANHAFEPNTGFVKIHHHPRLGTIAGLQSLRPIAADEEITVNYNYGQNVKEEDDTVPKWYHEALKRHKELEQELPSRRHYV